MKMRLSGLLALGVLALVTLRCGDDGLRGLGEKDGGVGAAKPDAGTVETPFDAGVVEEPFDAGTVEEPVDAGTVEQPFDAGIVEEPFDAGVVEEPFDAGVVDCGEPQIQPYSDGGPFGGFQSAAGTGFQTSITVTFSCPVTSVTVTILDPDFPLNEMVAYDAAGNIVASAKFQGDNAPGTYTEDTVTVSHADIVKVVLSPDPNDYVAYKDLKFTR